MWWIRISLHIICEAQVEMWIALALGSTLIIWQLLQSLILFWFSILVSLPFCFLTTRLMILFAAYWLHDPRHLIFSFWILLFLIQQVAAWISISFSEGPWVGTMLNEKENDTITWLINLVVRMMTGSHYLKLSPSCFILLTFVHVIFVDGLPFGKVFQPVSWHSIFFNYRIVWWEGC